MWQNITVFITFSFFQVLRYYCSGYLLGGWGGTLFCFFIFLWLWGAIPKISEMCLLMRYWCVLLNGKDYAHLIGLLNTELEKVSIWLKANKLSLNVKKTYYVVFQRSRIKTDAHAVITIDKVCLQRTDSFKYLGVIIDHKLNWTQHIAYVKIKFWKVLA